MGCREIRDKDNWLTWDVSSKFRVQVCVGTRLNLAAAEHLTAEVSERGLKQQRTG